MTGPYRHWAISGRLPGSAGVSPASARLRHLTAAKAIEVVDATATYAAGASDQATARSLGQSLKAKYLLDAVVNEFRFTLSALTGNTYNISVSASLLDGETGSTIWLLENHRIKEMSWVKDQLMGARGYVEQVFIPNIARYIADEALKRIAQCEASAPAP